MISVIVPVYKVENYLSSCVESLINQSYADIEIILVDDGSPDKCPAMCDELATKDGRIRVVHKTNGGLSSARNAGIEAASGEWLIFIDSDDYVDKDMIKKMVVAQQATGASVVVCDFQIFKDGEDIKKNNINKSELITYSPIEAANEFFSRSGIGWNAWNKIYQKSLFEKIKFPEGVYCEDKATVYKIYLQSTKVTYLKEPLYFYRIRSGSIMREKPTQLYNDTLRINEEICENMKTVDEKLYISARAYAAKCALLYYFENHKKENLKEINDLCLTQIRKYYFCVKNVSFLSKFEKIVVYICGKSLRLRNESLVVDLFGFLYILAKRR